MNAMDNFSDNMIDNFKKAIELYKETQHKKFSRDLESEDPWVLFVIDEAERNVIDQKIIETEL